MLRARSCGFYFALSILAAAALTFCQPAYAQNIGGLRIRVGVPLVARGPAGNIADNWLSEIKLPDGRFRSFTAAAETWAVDGRTPYDMGGPGKVVLKPGPAGSASACGEWVQHVALAGQTLIGWVHEETACNYKINQTHMSMSIATSNDYGLTWKFLGQIIRGTDAPAPRRETGDSCRTVIRGTDGYYYAYCLHDGGHAWEGGYVFTARAPIANPGPGSWRKYYNGAWTEPGIGGRSSNTIRSASAYWLTTNETIGVTSVKAGIGLAVAKDYLHFSDLISQPLMLMETGDWSRKNGLELYAYPDLIDADTGLNQIGDHWLLAYMYLKPGEGFSKRYLVFQPVDISWSRQPGEPEVGVMLALWHDAALHDYRATVSPVPGNYSQYKLLGRLGYLMTAPDAGQPTVELEECVSQSNGHPDHILVEKGFCESHGYQRLRNAGYVFAAPQPDAQPLYRCYSSADGSHFASNHSDCGKFGKQEALLGYDLKE